MKVAFLPIDNRPVCYTLPKIIAGIDKNIDFSLPKREFLGDLNKTADINALFGWLENLPNKDAIIISLDTLIYGGLIPSRRGKETLDELKARLKQLKIILQNKKAKVYAFSSIMRISNNNYNEEEKEYWAQYGKKIFEYSYNLHKNGKALTDVPQEIIEDYLNTRKRNFEINKIYLDLQKEGLFETLVFSKDDCAQFGLNVDEAQKLEALGGFTKTGADEIPLSLLSRVINKKLKIYPVFLESDYKNLISNYEDVSVENSVKGQIELAGCEVCSDSDNADLILYVNNFIERQGEIVMGVDTDNFKGDFKIPQKPYMIADVRFANGADNEFVKSLFKNHIADKNFYGYSGWNTTANTLGSLICGAKFKFCAENYSKENFKKLQITRFLDDWAYQANVRQMLAKPDINELSLLMKEFEPVVESVLNSKIDVRYSYPWNRLFEVEVWI
ncbi:DUF4127 family protein [bacterium]|nr:DUF4127 family protein [bacterium]